MNVKKMARTIIILRHHGSAALVRQRAPLCLVSNGTVTMRLATWQELANPRDLTKIFTTPEYAGWRSLRESDDARYLGHVPEVIARLDTLVAREAVGAHR